MSECIIWHGGTFGGGQYGRIGRNTYAHRHIWEQCFGYINPGEVIHHACENKLCINPEHLRLVESQAAHIRLHAPHWARYPDSPARPNSSPPTCRLHSDLPARDPNYGGGF